MAHFSNIPLIITFLFLMISIYFVFLSLYFKVYKKVLFWKQKEEM